MRTGYRVLGRQPRHSPRRRARPGDRPEPPGALVRLPPHIGAFRAARARARALARMAHADGDAQSSNEEIANWARLLNHPDSNQQMAAVDMVATLISREPVADEALLKGICRHEDSLAGLTRSLLVGDDESRQGASNLLFMLSMSEPEHPFDASCSAHMANRAMIGAAPGIFQAFVAGSSHFEHVQRFCFRKADPVWSADARVSLS